MSSIAEALKRAQQDRERLRPSGKVGESANAGSGEPSLAAVVLKRGNPAKAGPAVQEAPATAPREVPPARDAKREEEPGLARLIEKMPSKEAGMAVSTALKQAPPAVAPAARQEQRMAETIVEDYTSKRRLNLPASMVVYHDRAGAVAEQYRKLRDRLMAGIAGVAGAGGGIAARTGQVMVMTSAVAGEGKTVTTLNLGLSLVELRANRVLLIDGCLESNARRPALTDLLRLRAEKGLAELLAAPTAEISGTPATGGASAGNGNAEPSGGVEKYLKATPWHHLFVLPAGARTTLAAAAALLQSANLRAILRKVRANFDWVLIDAPPAAALPDAGLFGACADGMMLAVALHHTPHEKVQSVIRRLRSMNLPVKSCVVTRA